MSARLFAVVTTIQEPTECVRGLADALRRLGAPLVAVGDRKGPASFDIDGARFLPIAEQLEMPFARAWALPEGHYARKNLGYLLAIRDGAECIYETDDDNAPLPTWAPRQRQAAAQKADPRPWLNVYRLFSDDLLWPRGFPLDRVTDPATFEHDPDRALDEVDAPIQQGLADEAPDVDAVWRLLLDKPLRFERRPSVWLPPGTWCPFNSPSTWWWPPAFPLLYLPSLCSFRMTDIWRSFVAQRCLWELGCGLVFHAAEVAQERNVHNLMRDFRDEVPGYLGTEESVRQLGALALEPGPAAAGANMLSCYERLVAGGFFPAEELELVRAWLDDLARVASG